MINIVLLWYFQSRWFSVTSFDSVCQMAVLMPSTKKATIKQNSGQQLSRSILDGEENNVKKYSNVLRWFEFLLSVRVVKIDLRMDESGENFVEVTHAPQATKKSKRRKITVEKQTVDEKEEAGENEEESAYKTGRALNLLFSCFHLPSPNSPLGLRNSERKKRRCLRLRNPRYAWKSFE